MVWVVNASRLKQSSRLKCSIYLSNLNHYFLLLYGQSSALPLAYLLLLAYEQLACNPQFQTRYDLAMSLSITIDRAIPEQDNIIAQHFYQLWLDNNIPADSICDDWLSRTVKFMQDARRELEFQAFVARVENKIVGSASCQLFAGLYPAILKIEQRKYGYIWNVYVEPQYRRRGIAIELTKAAIAFETTQIC